MSNIHASCVSWQDKGILLLGGSSCGKSDLCLRLISKYDAVLVADDRVDLNVSRETILASAPKILEGMLEVRGVGILQLPFVKQTKLDLVVELVKDLSELERLPEPQSWEYEGVKLPLIKLFSFEVSAAEKIIAALSWPRAIK